MLVKRDSRISHHLSSVLDHEHRSQLSWASSSPEGMVSFARGPLSHSRDIRMELVVKPPLPANEPPIQFVDGLHAEVLSDKVLLDKPRRR